MTVPGSDIKWIQWHRVARNYQMRIGTNKKKQTFDGFLKDDFERLGNLCKQASPLSRPRGLSERRFLFVLTRLRCPATRMQYYNITLETKDVSVRGWNWGVAEVQGAFRGRLRLCRAGPAADRILTPPSLTARVQPTTWPSSSPASPHSPCR